MRAYDTEQLNYTDTLHNYLQLPNTIVVWMWMSVISTAYDMFLHTSVANIHCIKFFFMMQAAKNTYTVHLLYICL